MIVRVLWLALAGALVAGAQQPPEIAAITVLDFPFDFRPPDELGVDSPPPVAQGSIFKIWGLRMGPAPGIGAESADLPSELAGVRIEVESVDGVIRDLPLYWVGIAQINAVLPSDIEVGLAHLRVQFDGLASRPYPIRIVRTRPRIFDWRDGELPTRPVAVLPVVQVAGEDGSRRLVTQLEPARPGDMLVLWTTGLGPREGASDDQAAAEELRAPITVFLGQQAVEPDWVGRSGCCAAVDQVQFRLPEDTPLGCSVPLTLRAYGGVVSELERLPVTVDGASCATFDTPGAASNLGEIRFERTVSEEGVLDRFSAAFRTGRPVSTGDRTEGLCLPQTVFGVFAFGLEAGSPLEVEAPGETFTVENDHSVFSRTSSEPFLGPGLYTVTAPEGPEVGAFTAVIDAPEPPQALRGDLPDALAPESALTVSWSGDTPVDFVEIRDSVRYSFSDGFSRTDGGRFGGAGATCRPAPGQTSPSIPNWVMRGLTWGPADGEINANSSLSNNVEVTLVSQTEDSFQAAGLDTGTTVYRHREEIKIPFGGPFLPVTPVTTPSGEVVLAELAVSDFERERGLSGRRLVGSGRAMLLQYPGDGEAAFPTSELPGGVDLLWIDQARSVVASLTLAECSMDCAPVVGPAQADWALALPAGDAARLGLGMGSLLAW